MNDKTFDEGGMSDIEMLYQIRGVYDGWSAARLTDGRIVNRWPAADYPHRHAATQEWIDREFGEMSA